MQDKIPIKKVDTDLYLSAVKDILKEGKEVPLLLTGNSMSPFLVHERDKILIRKADRPLKKGDMAFFQKSSGQYVMHRIRYVRRSSDGKKQYYFIGDAQTVTEGPIEEDQIFGLITAVCRKGKWLRPGSFWWEFFRLVWLRMIPFRRTAIKIYSLVCPGK